MEMVTPRLRLRPFSAGDAAALAPLLGSAQVMAFSDTGPLSPEKQQAWLDHAITTGGHRHTDAVLAVTLTTTTQLIGYIKAATHPQRVGPGENEIGFRFIETAWGQGYATEALNAWLTHLDLGPTHTRIVAIVDPNNHRSVRVLEKLDLTPDGEVMFDGYDYPDHRYVKVIV